MGCFKINSLILAEKKIANNKFSIIQNDRTKNAKNGNHN